MTKESTIQRQIMLAAAEAGYTLWRNNVGQAWAGKPVKRTPSHITLVEYYPIRFGLCRGSADLIGFKPHVVTGADVGKTLAVFAGIEIKTPRGRTSGEQANFRAKVLEAGGIGIIARSAEDILDV